MDRLDALPGYRRRFIVTPAADWVRADLEDDFHCMAVTIRHDGEVATALEPEMARAPWTTCPGAIAHLQATFANLPLRLFAVRGEKSANCTHLHDLALLAAAHAHDARPLIYDVLVTDPIEGQVHAELRRDGETVMRWSLARDQFIAPPDMAGLGLFDLRAWIETLDPAGREAARVLRWGTMVAHGRQIPLAQLSDARRMPTGSCYTFQPHNQERARRIGAIRDFSDGAAAPLADRSARIET